MKTFTLNDSGRSLTVRHYCTGNNAKELAFESDAVTAALAAAGICKPDYLPPVQVNRNGLFFSFYVPVYTEDEKQNNQFALVNLGYKKTFTK